MLVIQRILPFRPRDAEGGAQVNVSLTPELEEYVAQKVQEGLYRSQSEVVRQALRLLKEQDRLLEARINQIRADVAVGLEQADRGELIPMDQVEARLKNRGKAKQG